MHSISGDVVTFTFHPGKLSGKGKFSTTFWYPAACISFQFPVEFCNFWNVLGNFDE